MFDSRIITDNLPVVGGFLITIGLFYKAWSETRRQNREAELKNKRDDLELTQLAAKFNIETVTGATTSAVSVLTSVADRLKGQLDDSDKEITTLKAARTERDQQISKLQEAQKKSEEAQANSDKRTGEMASEMERLREENKQKDQIIDDQEKRIHELEVEVEILKQKLHEAEAKIPLPDGVEHENGEKESGGGG